MIMNFLHYYNVTFENKHDEEVSSAIADTNSPSHDCLGTS